MAKYNIYGPFAGVKDGLTLLTLMDDKKKLKEMKGVLKALEDERQALNEAIEVYGKAKKMDGLLSMAETKNREADVALSAAKESAGQIQKDAKTWADDLRSKIVEREEAVTAGERKLAENEARHKVDVELWNKGVEQFEIKIAEREKTTVRLNDEALALKKRLDIALKSMKADVAAA